MSGTLGEFEVVVLMAVLHLGEGAYPPAVRALIESRTGRTAARGAVYVTLDRLEAKHLLTSRLDEVPGSGGRPRRFYRTSPRGRRTLRRALAGLERMRHGIDPLLAGES
ncbi:MAG: PadR family transcriptional regulator [Vicinamibacterales bacterium]